MHKHECSHVRRSAVVAIMFCLAQSVFPKMFVYQARKSAFIFGTVFILDESLYSPTIQQNIFVLFSTIFLI